jgi:serine/threonine protein kinase
MGQVWHVRHIDLDADRALKMLTGGLGGHPEMSRHFRREARVMASLSHPHAITVHDARFANDMTFIDMELLVGRTLADILRAEPPGRPLDWTARILEQLCDVLQAAHDRGIIHRDIKPTNIMLLDGRPEGREFVKLLDFGLASVAGQDVFGAGQIIGTPTYMSPELCRGEPVDHRSDLYSLGVTIYEILAGRKPFSGGSPIRLIEMILSEPPPPMRTFRPDLPEKVDELILSCLAKAPDDRPGSAREVAERFLWGLPPRYKNQHAGGKGGAVDSRLRPPPGYSLVRRLGGGGFGEVWEAVDEDDVRVALKFVRLEEEQIGKAEWDALQIIKNVRHPNLLVPFKSWQSPDHLILGMELAEGTLMQRLTEARKRGLAGIPRAEAIELLREAARGLDYLNSRSHSLDEKRGGGIYHCDIKPQNILLMGGAVKVADFGLSKFTMHSLTDREAGMTIPYAAPEFLNRKAARQSDQYSLAIVYCQVCGGRLPFTGSVAKVVTGHLTRMPDLEMIPTADRPAVLRALSKDPRHRFPSCTAFLDELARLDDPPTPKPSLWSSVLLWFRSSGAASRHPSEVTTEPETPKGPSEAAYSPPTRSSAPPSTDPNSPGTDWGNDT